MPIARRSFLRAGAGVTALATPGLPGLLSTPRARRATAPWGNLSGQLTGTLVLPADPGYAVAKQLHWTEFDGVNPSAVAYCQSAADVAACIRFAQDNGLPLVPRSGGHSPAGYSTTTGLVLDVSRLNSVRPDGATVSVGSGAQLVDVTTQLAPLGLAVPGGSCPTVGVAGFLQGGGFGLLTRHYGMGCDRIVSAEVVLADGTTVVCSANQEPDLYWALRGGGGGNFGVVTRFELSPVAVTQLSLFTLTWPWANAAAVMGAWQDWIIGGPRELASNLTVALSDAAPGNVPVAIVAGAWSGDPNALGAVLDQLVSLAGAAPATRSATAYSYHDAMLTTYGCSTMSVEQCHTIGATSGGQLARGNYLLARSRMVSNRIPQTGVAQILAAFDSARAAGHGRTVNFAALGGAANDPARTDTAYVHRDTQFLLLMADSLPTGTPTPGDQAAAEAWAANGFAVIDAYSNHETYQNYPDTALPDWRTAYYAENYPRLVATKAQYDPYRFFQFGQAID
ncbi:FAD-dependent oxidoreductase [Kitasatospora sp. GAS204B]|uniref:FAD-dependent oxidoreductase n=1 Tax=unclassified Kitasatospora TaxID=2633591 RepID=UPI0024768EA2|nr:FAD-dependent oxidoreductase [Kitasatospora sp. GAS204B]MDH6121821.1 FAD/FMN-containing dehydrogenase [Kitasatospora sp. GAS204B]